MKMAEFSPCRKYRYTLWRWWNDGLFPGKQRYVNFICLNPSTADEIKNDNTMTKCIKFAKRWGYDGMCVTNIFAWRDTDPKKMMAAAEPTGDPENLKYIRSIAHRASLIVCAWSQHGSFQGRSRLILENLAGYELHYLKLTTGEPHHPLYLPDSSLPVLWERS